MTKTEFLQELNEVLQGEVPTGVIQENLRYYDNYISQELAKGRTEEEIMEELGGPRIIARTIIDSSDAAGESGQSGAYYSQGSGDNGEDSARPSMNAHYTNLNKWYWKLLFIVVIIFVIVLVFTIVGGVFSLVFRFAGPLIIIWLVFSLFKGMRR